MRGGAMRRASGTLGVFMVLGIAVLASSDVSGAKIGQPPPPPPTPGWDTMANHPGDPNYHPQAYPIAFVKAPVSDIIVNVCTDTDIDADPPVMVCTNLTPAECN